MSSLTPTVTIRPATSAADFRQARALLHDYAHWITTATDLDPFREQPTFAVEIDDLAGTYGRDDAVLLVAFEDDLAVATAALRMREGAAELKRMYVRPAARGHGVAGELLACSLATATEQGCRRVWLESLEGLMDRAIGLYERFGFVRTGTVGVTANVQGMIVMERSLGD